MQTPKIYSDNLKKGLITEQMLDDALWSVNKRAKNWRDNKRLYKKSNSYYSSNNTYNAEANEKLMYSKKEFLLTILNPICIHKEFAGYNITRVKDDGRKDYIDLFIKHSIEENIVKIGKYYDYSNYINIDFFDYISKDQPQYRYYLFYETSYHSYHIPIDNNSIQNYKKKFNIDVIEISKLDTKGHDISDLLSIQFIDKMIETIKSGNYIYQSDFIPSVIQQNNIDYNKKTVSLKSVWNYRVINNINFSHEINKCSYELTEEEKKQIKIENEKLLKYSKNHKYFKYKCRTPLRIPLTNELYNILKENTENIDRKKLKSIIYDFYKNDIDKYIYESKKNIVFNSYSKHIYNELLKK